MIRKVLARHRRRRPSGPDAFAGSFAALREVRDETPPPPGEDDTQEIPVVAPESGPDPVPLARGLCPQCRKPVRLRKDGAIAGHRGCAGGGREPLALAECEVCAPLEPELYAETVHAMGHPVLVLDGDAAAA